MEQEFQELIAKYDTGTMSLKESVSMFQEMIDTGEVWGLAEKYRTQAASLIVEGYCSEPEAL